MGMPEHGRVAEAKRQAFVRRTKRYLELGHDRHAAAEFVADLPRQAEGSVLDIGTGKGLLAVALAERFPEVVSVDVTAEDSELAVLLADEAGVLARIKFLTLDAASLPFPDGQFGCVAMMDVLHHLEEGAPVLREAARVLRPAGTIVLADFTSEGLDLIARVHREDGREHPVGPATLEWASSWLQGQGFRMGDDRSGHLHRAIVLSKSADFA
jgi:ubiquinone/menaquinone biosynthesis C-methylase UbiE